MSATAALAAVALLVVGCNASGSNDASRAARRTPSPAPRAGCLPAGETARATTGPYLVGRRTTTFVDFSRPTAAVPRRGLDAKPDRTQPVMVLYPAAGRPGTDATPVDGAAPAPGRFPLVEFSHGVNGTGPSNTPWLATWARAGYVVVAPTFPLSSGRGADIGDIGNQPADVSFVLTSVVALAARHDDPLSGHVATDCIAVTGHSLGAATTLDVAYNSCCRDPRARAVVSISGVLTPIFNGRFDDAPPIPLMLLHGDADLTVSIGASRDAFRRLHGLRTLVTFPGGGHTSIFHGSRGPVLDEAVVAFLDAELKGETGELTALPAALTRSGVATFQRAG